eukprot:Pgem_evm1s2543
MMGERMSYELLAGVNATAPRITTAEIFVNEKFDGVYNFLEDVDKQFITYRVHKGAKHGGLWKELWFPANETYYDYKTAFKFGKKYVDKNNGVSLMMEIRKLAEECMTKSCSKEEAKAVVDSRLDKESFLNAFVGTLISNNFDTVPFVLGVMYEGNMINFLHNFYLYFNEKDNRITYIPWDYTEGYSVAPCNYAYEYNVPLVLPVDKTNHRAAIIESQCNSYPKWYETDFNRTKLCGANGIDSLIEPYKALPFACDAVGYVMAKAWREDFLERLSEVMSLPVMLSVNMAQSIAYQQMQSGIVQWAAQGGLPSEPQWFGELMLFQQKLALQTDYWKNISRTNPPIIKNARDISNND